MILPRVRTRNLSSSGADILQDETYRRPNGSGCKLQRASRAKNAAARRLPRVTFEDPSRDLQPA